MTSLVHKARALSQQGLYQEAIDIYEHLLEEDKAQLALWSELGSAYTALGDHQSLKKFLLKFLSVHPNQAQAHNNLARLYTSENNHQQALRHYRDALHLRPAFVLAHYNLGLLFLKQQDLASAQKQFNNVLALEPEHEAGRFYLAMLCLNSDRFEEAEDHLQVLLQSAPEHVEAWVNRGVVALKRAEQQLAINYFTQALILDNHHLEARHNIAATFMHFDRYEQALVYYQELLKEQPDNIEYLYNSAVAEMGLGRLNRSRELLFNLLRLEPKHFGALSNLAALYMRSGERALALQFLEQAAAIRPDQQSTRFMLQALKGQSQQAHCPTYAQELFDHYALHYDKHMEEQLDYRLPRRLWTLCHDRTEFQVERALDLGCGTGLIGKILRPFVKHLTGVDLSQKMLAIAKTKNDYNELIEAEVLSYLEKKPGQFDLIVAFDVLPYFGDLAALWQALIPCLAAGGSLWFNTEISENQSWILQDSLRYAHHMDYIETISVHQGLGRIMQERMVGRKQEDKDLWVNLYGYTS